MDGLHSAYRGCAPGGAGLWSALWLDEGAWIPLDRLPQAGTMAVWGADGVESLCDGSAISSREAMKSVCNNGRGVGRIGGRQDVLSHSKTSCGLFFVSR